MTTYTLYTNGVLEKDGFYLPIDFLNQDYIDYLDWVALGNSPTLQDASIYLAKLDADKTALQTARTEYQNMITRLEQIQAASNPTNAQIVQAIKDEALYIERIMKVIRRILT